MPKVSEQHLDARRRHVLVDHDIAGAVRAVAAEHPEWPAMVIEAEGKLRHDEEFVRRIVADGDPFDIEAAAQLLNDALAPR